MKRALCLTKVDVWNKGILPNPEITVWNSNNQGVFEQPYEMLSREGENSCENNPSYLQLIPYIVLRNTAGAYFCYSRGAKGNEDRLHAKLSVGLGGHIDTVPENGDSLYVHASKEAARELQEEVGLSVDWLEFNDLGFVYEEETEVGKVHLGYVVLYQMTEEETVGELEVGQIEEGQFVPLEDLLQPEVFDRMEKWSQSVLEFLMYTE